MPSSSASAHACSPPAPPNATSANSRGSSPRSTEITRSARPISALATRTTPSAVSSASRSSSLPSVSSACLRALGRQRQLAAELGAVAEVAEQQVGVGHRRLLAALAVGGRARVGARRARADAQRAARIGPRDRAAAGADRVDVDHRQLDRHAGHDRLRRRARLAAHHRRDVGARAAHVEGQHVLVAAGARDVRRADHAAGRARRARSRPPGARPPRRRARRPRTA